MSAEPAISVVKLSKAYPLFDRPWDRLRHLLTGRQPPREFKALEDISFDVAKGESVGIIGRNGSGKSTLLQVIAGTLTPSEGEVRVDGRVAALLELGSGFNPEFTGRENVYLNGAILGCSRAQIDDAFDEIAAFADIGEFIDEPVKEYSSGMMMRLAFAVQVSLKPEILIVDEALAVGDYFFQQKCFARLRALRDNGLTLLFVSHDMGTVRDLCSTAVYLKQGKSKYIGDSKTAARLYLAEQTPTSLADPEANTSSALISNQATNLELAEVKKTAFWAVTDDEEQERRLLAVRLLGSDGQAASHARMCDTIRIQVFFRTAPGEAGHISFTLKNRFDQVVSSTGTYLMGLEACSSGSAPFAVAEFEVGLMLEAGLYSLMFAYGQPTQENQGKMIDNTGWIGPLHIEWDYEGKRAPFLGMFGLPVRAKLVSSEELTK